MQDNLAHHFVGLVGQADAGLEQELGDRVRHADSLCGVEVDLDYVLHDRQQVLAALAASDLVVDEWYVRAPVGGEADTKRLYVLARKAG